MNASSSAGRFLRGSGVPTQRRYGGSSGGGPGGCEKTRSIAFGITRMLRYGTSSSPTTSRAVARETQTTRSAPRTARGISVRP